MSMEMTKSSSKKIDKLINWREIDSKMFNLWLRAPANGSKIGADAKSDE